MIRPITLTNRILLFVQTRTAKKPAVLCTSKCTIPLRSTHTHTHTHTHARTHVHTHTHIHSLTHTYIYKYNILYIYFDAPFDDAVCCERLQSLLLSKSPAENVFPFIGFKWWELYDSNREVTNWGLVTRLGNAYDGVQARTGVQACTAEEDLVLEGHECGGEAADYGDMLTAVAEVNVLSLRIAAESAEAIVSCEGVVCDSDGQRQRGNRRVYTSP